MRLVRTPGGRRRVPESETLRIQGEGEEEGRVIGYARVSSPSQKDDLERQISLIKSREVEEIYTDAGSGLNDGRRSFKRILKRLVKKEISRIIISYPDRLTRFGFACSRR